MTAYLLFRLHGPMAAWGDVAVGERRVAGPMPSRSAVLGLVAGALRYTREQADELGALDEGVGFASRLDAEGELMVDYHTAQTAPAKLFARTTPPATRREQLAFSRDELSTILSWRDYRCDAMAMACLWKRRDDLGPSLEQIAAALRRPGFVPYLGRKACPTALPLAPRIVEAEHPVLALEQGPPPEEVAFFAANRELARARAQMLSKKVRYGWEGTDEGDAKAGVAPLARMRRRDAPRSRVRWQFGEREERVLLRETHTKGET